MKSLAKIGLLLVLIAFLTIAFLGPRYFVESKQEHLQVSPPETKFVAEAGLDSTNQDSEETTKPITSPKNESSTPAPPASPEIAGGAEVQNSKSVPTAEAPIEVAVSELIPILEKVEEAELTEATELASSLANSLKPGDREVLDRFLVSMNTEFSEKKALRQELDATVNSLALTKAKLAEVERELSEIDRTSLQQMATSVEELKQATLSAKKATEEASRLTTKLKDIRPIAPVLVDPATPDEPSEVPTGPLKLPEPTSVTFGFDSTYINSASSETLTQIAGVLKNDPRIQLKLRGNSDTTGPSDYNALLANSRCEAVKKFLSERGVSADRISIIPVNEGETGQGAESSKKLRRVDLLFSES